MAGRAQHERELTAAMDATQRSWTERSAGSTVVVQNPYIAAVPQDILDHPQTDIETLKDYCRERGITFGDRPSLSVLRAKLMASNADLQTVWSMRMTSLAVVAMTVRAEGHEDMDQFQHAMFHSPSVAPDGPPGVVVASSAQPSTQQTPAIGSALPSASPPAPASSPPTSQFRRPPVPFIRFPGSPPDVITAPASDGPTRSPGDERDKAGVEDEGLPMRESERLYLQYCSAKRAEEARDIRAQQQQNQSEIKGLLVSLGQSMANVSGAVQAHAASSTVTAQRHADGLVAIAREQTALRATLQAPPPSLSAARPPKRQKVTVVSTSLGLSLPAAGDRPAAAAPGVVSASSLPTVRLEMLFSPVMEAELMEARLASAPLASQLQKIVRLAHVSAGKPGLFGSYVVFGLYESAGSEAAALSGPGDLSKEVNKEKQRRMKNIIGNKADTYVRLLFWLRTVVPEVLETPAAEATVEKMEQFVMTKALSDKLQQGLRMEAHKAKYQPDHPILNPVKARMSTLRDLLHVLVVDHGYASNVDDMLKTPPFAERLAEASKRIRPRYETSPPSPVTASLPLPTGRAQE